MDTPTAIRTYLEEYHTGIDNAVFSRELERRFSLNGRSLRRIISYLRREGYPIGSSATGYFYAENKREIDLTISSFISRIFLIVRLLSFAHSLTRSVIKLS